MSARPALLAIFASVTRERWAGWLSRLEHAVESRVADFLRRRPGWVVTVDPYIGYGTSTRAHLQGRVVVRPRRRRRRAGPTAALVTGLARYASVDVAGEQVTLDVAGRTATAVSGLEGYVEVDVELPDVVPGWHDVSWRTSADTERGRLLVVDPDARLGVVSDLDDTVIHTGLTRAWESVRTTLLVPDDERVAILGGPELYQALVAGDGGRAPVFYVSAGAWNLHRMLVSFLARHGFPAGPLVLTDWGPTARWLFRENSAAFKARTIVELMGEHPGLSWVLVGDSGQHDPEAYAAVVRSHRERVRAVYIRDVPPQSPQRAARVHGLAEEMAGLGVPMLLISDSVEATEHAYGLGLVDEVAVQRVRAAVRESVSD